MDRGLRLGPSDGRLWTASNDRARRRRIRKRIRVRKRSRDAVCHVLASRFSKWPLCHAASSCCPPILLYSLHVSQCLQHILMLQRGREWPLTVWVQWIQWHHNIYNINISCEKDGHVLGKLWLSNSLTWIEFEALLIFLVKTGLVLSFFH